MCKSQQRNTRHVREEKQGHMTPSKLHNSLVTDSKYTDVNELPGKKLPLNTNDFHDNTEK
jgi:hypothetical protein